MFSKIVLFCKEHLPRGLKQRIKNITGLTITSVQKVSTEAKIDTDAKSVNIAVHTGGGIGDFIVYSAIFDQLQKMCDCRIWLFTWSYDNAVAIIGGRQGISIFFPTSPLRKDTFDLVLDIDHYVHVREYSAARLKSKAAGFYRSVVGIIEYNKKNIPVTEDMLAQRNVIIFRSKYLGLNRWTQLSCGGVFDMESMRSALQTDEHRTAFIEEHGLRRKGYITISCGADKAGGGMNQTKIWPPHRYAEFIELFKQKHPDIDVVQLALSGEPEISVADLLLCNVNIEDVKAVLKYSLVHISNEGGMVHLSTQLSTPCVVVFGPTPAHYYGYPQNANIVSPVCSGCMEAIPDWFTICPRGFAKPECMDAITGKMVFESVSKIMGEKLPHR